LPLKGRGVSLNTLLHKFSL